MPKEIQGVAHTLKSTLHKLFDYDIEVECFPAVLEGKVTESEENEFVLTTHDPKIRITFNILPEMRQFNEIIRNIVKDTDYDHESIMFMHSGNGKGTYYFFYSGKEFGITINTIIFNQYFCDNCNYWQYEVEADKAVIELAKFLNEKLHEYVKSAKGE